MKSHTTAAIGVLLISSINAFPQIAEDVLRQEAKNSIGKRQIASPGFNAAAQHVSTSGKNVFVAPKAGDQRGPCPGLNALANHGYLPHNGIGTIAQFVSSCYAGFGMGEDLGGFLGIYGAIFDGDLTEYSIGFAANQLPIISGLIGTPQGLGGSHNKYENDASPIRGDLYTYGESYKNQISLFEQFYDTQSGVPANEVNYDLDIIKEFRKARFDNSIQTNPYFFNGPFSGAIASPAAYSFIFRFMANKSAEYPEGRLDREVLKTFYAISGEPGSFKYNPGYERFPENWYKRAIGDEYTIPYLAIDALGQITTYPEFISVGGNTGTVNTFTGFDPANITGGVINAGNLAEGDNFACYVFQLGLQTTPDLLEGLFTDVTPVKNQLVAAFDQVLASLTCPDLENLQYNQAYMQATFPGYGKSYDGYNPSVL